MSLDDVNTVDTACEYLKLTLPQLKRLIAADKIGFLRTGRTLTFTREDLEAYVQTNRVQPAPPNPHGLTDKSLRRLRRAT